MNTVRLQQQAFVALLALPGLQRRPGGHLEHLPHAVLGFGRALHVSEGTDAVGHVSALLGFDGLLRTEREATVSDRLCTGNTLSHGKPDVFARRDGRVFLYRQQYNVAV